MTFNEGGQFEGGRVRRGGGRRGVAVAGGGVGALLITLLVVFLSGGDLGSLSQVLGTGDVSSVGEGQEAFVEDCTAQEANTDRECRLSATAQSLDAVWGRVLPEQASVQYVLPGVTSFSGAVDTGCGSATSATGPFYCPLDQTVYVDVSFFDELRERFGSTGGSLAEEYVIAHEFGHHIEQLVGAMDAADRSGTGPESDAVRIELMADCLAGMWAHRAATEVDPDTGVTFLEPITDAQLRDALSAAAAVGDDRIQEATTGQVNPEAFTHGTSEQRVRWFSIGYNGGTMQDCNTLEAATL
ncbi:neutral zinc metallopeptidase [Antribacter sp. KLBMP9083]|uniref:Neutral zinc metallopeptidase n=1 Tax=Antribacter soli TaxID=2910976 RepID=A0AA41QF22_9MICO|nr:neutral zinc metallopeptidase [Antribacter soli]MCF4121476.1 neutral zinc metallopeptidase [Antribacter soli]